MRGLFCGLGAGIAPTSSPTLFTLFSTSSAAFSTACLLHWAPPIGFIPRGLRAIHPHGYWRRTWTRGAVEKRPLSTKRLRAGMKGPPDPHGERL
ncbi:MAG: hypothetical protein ACPL3C_07030 [Pyrobaculum sp.]